MLTAFDWIRRVRSGSELLAILQMLRQEPGCFTRLQAILGFDVYGPPPNALAMPCERCWLYPRLSTSIYCIACRVIRDGTRESSLPARDALVIWGHVNRVPQPLRQQLRFGPVELLGNFSHDAHHLLLMLRRQDLQSWLQELLLYYGAELRGYLQFFPSVGINDDGLGMGDLLCQAIRNESYFPLDRLRLRFYVRPHHLLLPQNFDRDQLLTYEASEFVSLLEMAVIYRSVLPPTDQAILYELLTNTEEREAGFYWGRLMGVLNQQGRDLLEAWNIRLWPEHRVHFFYELTRYVAYRPTD